MFVFEYESQMNDWVKMIQLCGAKQVEPGDSELDTCNNRISSPTKTSDMEKNNNNKKNPPKRIDPKHQEEEYIRDKKRLEQQREYLIKQTDLVGCDAHFSIEKAKIVDNTPVILIFPSPHQRNISNLRFLLSTG